MERRFSFPTAEELAQCDVPPELSATLPSRFRHFATPFGDLLESVSDRYYFYAILEGLVSTGRKNLESIAYSHNHDRQMYQNFVGLKGSGTNSKPLDEKKLNGKILPSKKL